MKKLEEEATAESESAREVKATWTSQELIILGIVSKVKGISNLSIFEPESLVSTLTLY